MQPSEKYTSTEKTGNGFKVKVTNDPIKTLFTLNSDTDLSIAYTNTSHNEFREICQFFGSGTFNVKPYLRDEVKFSHVYQTSASQDPPAGYVDICKLHALNLTAGKYQQASPYIVFINATQSSTAHNYYWYGQNEREEAANNRNLSDVYLVSDFEVNKAIFYATVRGYTKTEYENYLANGTVVSDHDIDLWDFIASPSNYYISHFGMVAQYTWNEDNNRWDTVHTNCRITPALLFNAGTAKGITNINNAYFAGTYSGSAETQISNNTAQSARHTSRTGTLSGKSMGQLYDQIIDSSWCIGSPVDLELDPDMLQTDWDNNNEATIAFSGTTDKKEYYTDYHYTLFGWEEYNWGYNYGTSEGVPCHCTKYEFHLQRLIKGESVSALMASCGVYVTDTSNLTTFRGYNITPTSMESSHIKLGEMLPDGSTSGVWINGPNLDEYTGPNKAGSIVHPDYNPSSGGGGSDDDDPSDDQSWGGAYSSAGAFSKFYLCTATDLANLRTWFSGGGGGDQIPDGFDPMGQVLGLLQYPVSISGTALAAEEIVFRSGKTIVHTNVNATRSTGGFLHLDCGSVEIPRRMQERGVPFLDFETSLEIYVPFCGTAPLDVQACVGKTLTCDMYVATATGDVSAVIAAGGHPVAYMSGNMAESLPISSAGYGMYLAACKSTWGNGVSQVMNQLTGGTTDTLKNVNQAALNETLSYNQTGGWGRSELIAESYNNPRIGSAMAAAAGPTGAAAIGLIKTGLNVMNAATTGYEQYRRVKNASYTSVSGSFTSCAAWNYPFTPYVKITRPHKQIPTGGRGDYKHTAAIPLVETKTLSGAPGLTTCVNPDVSGIANATAQEKDIIYRALVNGVIV